MKKVNIISLIGIFLTALLIEGCKKTMDVTVPTPLQVTEGDDPDREFQDYLASAPNIAVTLDDLLLSNGATIKEFLKDNPEFQGEFDKALKGARLSASLNDVSLVKKVLFAQVLLFIQAHKLTNITSTALWDNDAQTMVTDLYKNKDYFTVDGRRIYSPKQPYGLGYSYGQRKWQERLPPPSDMGGTCLDAAIYGLDCSGFIINVFQQAGFKIPNTNVAGMYSKTYWEKVLESNKTLDSIKVDFVKNTLGATKYTASTWQTLGLKPGDIVFWEGKGKDGKPKWNHIGIVFQKADKQLGIFQSNGIANPDPTNLKLMLSCDNITRGDCQSNYACEGRGVRAKALKFISDYKGGANPISVIRLSALIGNEGNPRFNLRFTNDQNVDLDLHVRTPAGFEIYYRNKLDNATQGQLDVDCFCTNCPNGPNENIFWPLDKPSPTGKYRFWVNYYESCGRSSNTTSNYEILLVNDKKPEVLFKATGTMTPSSVRPIWEYDTETKKVTKIQ